MAVDTDTPRDTSGSTRFQVRQCTRETCGLRFSTFLGDPKAERCPICRAETSIVDALYEQAMVEPEIGRACGPELEVLLDNIRSAWNVGSMLRSADGAGVRHVHMCGVSSTPDNPKVAKTALGAEKSLPWTFAPDGVAAAQALKGQGLRLWALEGGPRAESLFDAGADLPGPPLVLVAGNELSGVDPGILALCERVVCLPMQGVKGSLNVAVAFGIAVYYIRFGRCGVFL
jgi:23S rRNA (guanosine2251-2'-O)-methyltransferase